MRRHFLKLKLPFPIASVTFLEQWGIPAALEKVSKVLWRGKPPLLPKGMHAFSPALHFNANCFQSFLKKMCKTARGPLWLNKGFRRMPPLLKHGERCFLQTASFVLGESSSWRLQKCWYSDVCWQYLAWKSFLVFVHKRSCQRTLPGKANYLWTLCTEHNPSNLTLVMHPENPCIGPSD